MGDPLGGGAAVGVVGDTAVEPAFVIEDCVAVDGSAGGGDVIIEVAQVDVAEILEERHGRFVAIEEIAAVSIPAPEEDGVVAGEGIEPLPVAAAGDPGQRGTGHFFLPAVTGGATT